MRPILATISVVLIVGMLAGCNTLGRQPKLSEALITPSELKPGDSAVITVKVTDRQALVTKVEGIVREDPSIKLKLRDDGAAPDQKAGDSVWTLQVDVPFQAPPGDFTLEITAFRSDGSPVPVKNEQGKSGPLMTVVPIKIAAP